MTAITAPLPNLSKLLREGSTDEHTSAENSGFMTELMAGQINARGYSDYLSRLRRIYDALETVAAKLADDPIAAAVIDPHLERLGSIETDLSFWGEGDAASPATDAYVERINAAQSWAGLFVAHHYTRYLGDLSGGQIAGRMLARAFGPDGLSFYSFPQIPKPKPYKDAYRARLDGLRLSDEQKKRMLAEVKVTFGLNQGLFVELGENLDVYRR